MIVTCTRCATHFQLDDARLPLKGARVRCSRCKQAFFLAHPHADHTDAVRTAAREALEERVPRPPEPTPEIGDEAVEAPAEPAAGGALELAAFEDQMGSEFNFDPQASTVSLDSLPTEGEPSLFGSVDDLTAEWEQEGDTESGFDSAKSAEPEVSAQEETQRPPPPQSQAVPLGRLLPSPAPAPPPASTPGPAIAQNGFGRAPACSDSAAVALPSVDSGVLEALRGDPAARWHTILFGLGHALGWGATLGLLLMGLASGL